ncbi:sensor histidine kinase [Nitriliruptor alkaliphilus]|uniref:sensor histidine kinase n=1 Tax=Nitriliruptor alkaliphilus TaxID=427918 RepID=UPI0006977293|nr:HAMP domain-containing sensor histidine kinase [Nitriliruptor alkaliphilus]
MRARIGGLIAVELLLVLLGLWIVSANPVPVAAPGVLGIAVFAVVLMGLNLLPRIYLEHRRHGCWITPSDGAILVGLFTLGPFGFVAATLCAEVVPAVRYRQAPLKLVFNLVSMLGGYTAAAATFALLGRVDPLDPLAWAAGLAAMAACAIWDVVSTAALFSIAEKRPFREMVNGVGPALLLSLLLSAALGLVALVLLHETPFGAVLVAPVLAILVVSTRSVSHAQAERNRLERLYTASGNLARLVTRNEALAAIATEGKTLITGGAAVCLTERPDGSWIGVLVDDDGARDLPSLAVARLLTATSDGEQGVAAVPADALDAGLPDLPSLAWATGTADPDVRVVLAVLLDLPSDEQASHRVDVLATFVAHAATVLANVELHEDVQEALDHQVELNRQKGEFVAAVSHELRTPLASMIGAVQTVQRAHSRMTPEQLSDILALGSAQGARLRSLIEDLLLVAAAEHQAVRVQDADVEPGDLLDAVVAELTPDARERLRLHAGEVSPFLTDRDKVHRILLNLIDNARKYAPEGPIDLAVSTVGDQVRFTVDDAGPGIRHEDRERIFERFVQLDQSSTRRNGGTGLGLHLCRQLAELLGGGLTVTGSPTGGARFTLLIPARPCRPPVAVGGEVAAEGPSYRPGRSPTPNIVRSPLRRTPAPSRQIPADVVSASPHVGGSS